MKTSHLLLLLVCLPFFTYAQHASTTLGISGRHLSEHMAMNRNVNPPYGTYVYRVYGNSAAEQLDLQVFDYVYKINDYTVNDTMSIGKILNKFQLGEEVSVTYLRNGRQMTGNATLTSNNEVVKVHRQGSKDPFLGVESIHERRNKNVDGVPINVVPNSTAWAMGLQKGDIITKVDNYSVYSWDDLGAAIDDREVGDYIELEVYRDGDIMEFNRPIKSRAATHNDHSRGPSLEPAIVEGPSKDEPTSEVEVVETIETEIEALSEKVEMEMPLASDLQVTQLNVFPNPNTGIFDIDFSIPEEGTTSVRIFSPSGQIIYENNLGNFSGRFNDRIDIANNAKGIYFLSIVQRDQAITRKIILQ